MPYFAPNICIQLFGINNWRNKKKKKKHFVTFSMSLLEATHWETHCTGTGALVEVKDSFRVQPGLRFEVGEYNYFFCENRKLKNSVKCLPLTPLPGLHARGLLVDWINAAVCHLTWASLGDRSYLLSHSSELNCISRKTWANAVYSRVTCAALKRLNNFLLQCAHCWMKCGNKAWRST